MAEYQRVEYRIGPDGKITETVIGATGDRCTATTDAIEQALGNVEQRDYLPEYYDNEDALNAQTIQQGQQQSS